MHVFRYSNAGRDLLKVITIQLLVILGCAAAAWVLWLWLRRARSYPYKERAEKIHQALRDGSALQITYWSKRRRRFLHRMVTPLAIDGEVLRGHDHTIDGERSFRVTRIKEIELVPGRAKHFGPPLEQQRPWRLVLGLIAATATVVVVLAALVRMNARSSPPAAGGVETAAVERIASPQLKDKTVEHTENRSTNSLPEPTVKWNVVVESDSVNSMNYVSRVFQRVFECPEAEAERLALIIHTEDRGVVWSGDRRHAEDYLHQLQEAHLIVRLDGKPIEQAENDSADVPPEPGVKWDVVVESDSANSMSYVSSVFQRVLQCPGAEAERLTLAIHTNGRSVVWSGHRRRAEDYLRQLQEAHLNVLLEKAP